LRHWSSNYPGYWSWPKVSLDGGCVKGRRRDVAEPACRTHRCTRTSKESVMETYDPNKSTTEVRQASPRKMNARVLVISMIGVIVLFGIIYMIYTLTQSNPT
jgi:hypothetical protein